MQSHHDFCGKHVFGELYGIKASLLNDLDFLKEALANGVCLSGATIEGIQEKQFFPRGITLLCLLSESHASIHTYPEHQSMFFDAFTCGRQCHPEKIAEALISALKPSNQNLKVIMRGAQGEELFSGDLKSPELLASSLE
jgi:S-adenosylmethionine decarboxylase